jgi:septal ring factor EnvC (AmiA/AmiB activator)
MSSQSIQRKVEELTARMAEAAAAEDFERAAALRNELEALKGTGIRKPPPGEMGLGTHIPVAAPPKGWKRPKKPDPLTTNVRRGK